ncbi:hypothetical protein [uncultured Sphaerochaeta sp.]|uniref:lipopolysaccharide biosynthesis protein n=1 Tax=uncultured Sphaerochaeta sp. TaxID=886478 RepID=UPI002A0A5728|nr:hypothetical protein [uncultured Sphaerochaeta sp.]
MELGVGAAIGYSMYRPLALGENEKIQALMQLYRKTYTLIGVLVLVIGLSLTPLLPFFLGEVPEIPDINLIYSLFVLNSGLSYFLSYKRTILIADQKKYIDTTFQYGFQIVKALGQILVLLISGDFILFLLVMIGATLAENLAASYKVNQLYPYLKYKEKKSLGESEKLKIKKNIIALTFHKIGTVIVSGTDNILMVKFVSLVSAGIYSNYFMVLNALNKFLGVIFNSLIASVGNLVVEKEKAGSKPFFDQVNFFSFWVFGFCSICLLLLFNPFISLWLGPQFLFDMPVVFIIVINFYLTGMLRPVRTFYASMGLFWFDRYKPLFESAINLGFSIFLVQKIGLIGVLIGTTISTVTTIFWFEPFVLFHYGFELPIGNYFFKYFKYTIITIGVGYCTFFLVTLVSITSPLLDFLVSMIICGSVPNILYTLVYYRSREFDYVRALVRKIIPRRSNTNVLE